MELRMDTNRQDIIDAVRVVPDTHRILCPRHDRGAIVGWAVPTDRAMMRFAH